MPNEAEDAPAMVEFAVSVRPRFMEELANEEWQAVHFFDETEGKDLL